MLLSVCSWLNLRKMKAQSAVSVWEPPLRELTSRFSPRPPLSNPDSSSAFVLRTMSVDVAHTDDWATLLDLGELRAYVLHLALADLQARGFVRPLALAVIAPRPLLAGPAMHNLHPALATHLGEVAACLKAPAQRRFARELEQRARDLAATARALDRGEGRPTSVTPSSVHEALDEVLLLRHRLLGTPPESAPDAPELGEVLAALPRGRFAEALRPLPQLVGSSWSAARTTLDRLRGGLAAGTLLTPPRSTTLALGGVVLADFALRDPMWASLRGVAEGEDRFASASDSSDPSDPSPDPSVPAVPGSGGDEAALWAWREERWPCAPALVSALLRGRALILLVPPSDRTAAERTVRALAHFVATPLGLPLSARVQGWREEPLSVGALALLRLVAVPSGRLPAPLRRVALVLPWELRRSASPLPLPPPAAASLAARLLTGNWSGPSSLAAHVRAQLAEGAGVAALAWHTVLTHCLGRTRGRLTEPQRLRALEEALGGFFTALRVGPEDAAVLRHWLQLIVAQQTRPPSWPLLLDPVPLTRR